MKTYNIKVGQYRGWAETKIEIPEEVFFFCNKGEVGSYLNDNAEHYHTVVETSKYKDWIKSIGNAFGSEENEIGEYTIITINSLCNDTPIPTIDRKEWFERNNIDFSKYIIRNRDLNYNIMNVYRIKEFFSPWDIKCACVTRRDFFSQGELYLMKIENSELHCIVSRSYDEHVKTKIFQGEEGEKLWNSMIYQVVSRVGYNSEVADEHYNFDKERNEVIEMLKQKGLNDFVNLMENN